jgi:hypothetical protein
MERGGFTMSISVRFTLLFALLLMAADGTAQSVAWQKPVYASVPSAQALSDVFTGTRWLDDGTSRCRPQLAPDSGSPFQSGREPDVVARSPARLRRQSGS